MAITLDQIKVGDRVYYQPEGSEEHEFDPGVVSYISEERKDSVYVIFKPNRHMNNFKKETQALTLLEDLHLGGSPEEARINNFLKYADT